MIEATCAACGTLNRIAEGDVPPGAKFVTCSSCKSRVAIAARPPPSTMKVPAIPALSPKAPPPIPVPVTPGAKPVIDLADLPAPKRSNPLAGAGDAKPAPKSALGDLAAKPAPKSPFADLEVDLPAPKASPRAASSRGVDDLAPMNVPPSAPAIEPPVNMALGAAGAGGDAISDLPAPKSKPPLPSITKKSVPDAPAPKNAPPSSATKTVTGIGDITDLPAPKPGPGSGPARTAVGIGGPADIIDLPAPKGIIDLPAPKGPSTPPTPASKPGAKTRPGSVSDLPAPKDPKAKSSGDPPRPRATTDLPAPKPGGRADLPAPKGFFDDAPAPAPTQDKPDLPAPKGFFDDLPQPALTKDKPDLPAPKGFFDDLPQPALTKNKPDLPAPKGFFEDLPQPALTPSKPDLPAPKGFFDDLPQPALAGKPDLPAPKGFFEDIPQPALTHGKPDLPAPKGFYDNLPQRAINRPPAPLVGDLAEPEAEIDLPLATESQDIELQGPSPELDLGLPMPSLDEPPPRPPAGGDPFGDLDLSKPSASGGIRFEKPTERPKTSRPPTSEGATPPPTPAAKGSDVKLELADDPPSPKATTRQATQRAQTNKPSAEPKPKPTKKPKSKIVLGSVLFVALAGAGGFYMYQRHEAAQARADEIATQLIKARAARDAADATHWQRATTAAKAVLAEDDSNAEALAIGAEASYAGALETGINGPTRIAQARAMINAANKASINSPELDRARALDGIVSNQPDRAIAKLQPLLAKNPKDPYLSLYLGWALLAKGDGTAAIKAFDDAIAANPNVKASALYSRGKARLVMGDLAGARSDFAAVQEVNKDHIAAMVGLAAAGPPSQSSQREADLLAILARKDVATADQRAIVQAWTLAGDVARGNGRLDVARERYNKARAINATDVPALTGLAATELRDGKLGAANELITKALTQSADDVDAQLVASELAIREGKLKDAETRLTAIAGRQPPVPPLQEARMHLAKGKLADARGQGEAAVDEYIAGAKVAGDLDLAPAMAAVTKLGELAAKDPAKAADYHSRADQLLSSLAERAKEDAQMSMMIGVAYLDAGDAAKAETFLRRTVEMRDHDTEAMLALAKALVKLNRIDDAIEQLKAAYMIDSTRVDVSLELARTFEAAGRDADATQAYDKLLAAKEIPVQARVHAGRFFARIGQLDKAVLQADPILEVERDNAAGHYLKGESLLIKGKLEEARRELIVAISADPDPYYYDAAGRVDEESLRTSGDTKYITTGLHNYDLSHQGLATLFNPLAGMGRLYILRKEFDQALKVLLAANSLKASDPEVMFNIGVCYMALGHTEQKKAAIDWLVGANKLKSSAETSWRLGQLYEDPDINQGNLAAAGYTSATRLAEEEEKKTGKPVEWLTEAYAKLGMLYIQVLNDPCSAKKAFERHLSRTPPPPASARLTEIKTLMNSTLKSCGP